MRSADRVLIIGFEDKSSDTGDNEITRGTDALAKKAKDIGIPVEKVFYIYGSDFIATTHSMTKLNPMMRQADLDRIELALGRLTDNSELILRGHGNATFATLSKIGGETMGNFLCHLGLKANCKINITACKAARGSNQLDADAMDINITAQAISEKSFARTLSENLYRNGLRNELHARVQNVKVASADGSKTTRTHGSTVKGDHTAKQAHSKIIFRCGNDKLASCSYAY